MTDRVSPCWLGLFVRTGDAEQALMGIGLPLLSLSGGLLAMPAQFMSLTSVLAVKLRELSAIVASLPLLRPQPSWLAVIVSMGTTAYAGWCDAG